MIFSIINFIFILVEESDITLGDMIQQNYNIGEKLLGAAIGV